MADLGTMFSQALDATKTITATYFNTQAAKEAAKVQSAIQTSTIKNENNAKVTANTTKNILLIVGGTLGLLLLFQTAKKVMR